MIMRQREADVQRTIRDFLLSRGWRPVRTQFAFVQGAMQTGERYMPDYLFLRPIGGDIYAGTLALYVEFKSPNARLACRCAPGKLCRLCGQKQWQKRERERGFIVWSGVDDVDWFIGEYERLFGHLHAGPDARGQLDLLSGLARLT